MKKTETAPNATLFYELKTLRQNEQEVTSAPPPAAATPPSPAPKESVIDIEEPPTPNVRNSLPSCNLPRTHEKNFPASRASQQESYTRFVRSILFEENESTVTAGGEETASQSNKQESSSNPDPLMRKIPVAPNVENFLPGSATSEEWVENELNKVDVAPPIPPRLERTPVPSQNTGFSPNAVYMNDIQGPFCSVPPSIAQNHNGSFSGDELSQNSVPQSLRLARFSNGDKYSSLPASPFTSALETSMSSSFSPISSAQTDKLSELSRRVEFGQNLNSLGHGYFKQNVKDLYLPTATFQNGLTSVAQTVSNKELNSRIQHTSPQNNHLIRPASNNSSPPNNHVIRPASSDEYIRSSNSLGQKFTRLALNEKHPLNAISQGRSSSESQYPVESSLKSDAQHFPPTSPPQVNHCVRPTSSEESLRNFVSQSRRVVRPRVNGRCLPTADLQKRPASEASDFREFLENSVGQTESVIDLSTHTQFPLTTSLLYHMVRPTSSEESLRSFVSESQRIMRPEVNGRYFSTADSHSRPVSGSSGSREFLENSFAEPKSIATNAHLASVTNAQIYSSVRPTSSEESLQSFVSESHRTVRPKVTGEYLPTDEFKNSSVIESHNPEETSLNYLSQNSSISELSTNDKISPVPTSQVDHVGKLASSEESLRNFVLQGQKSFQPPVTERFILTPGSQSSSNLKPFSFQEFPPNSSLHNNSVSDFLANGKVSSSPTTQIKKVTPIVGEKLTALPFSSISDPPFTKEFPQSPDSLVRLTENNRKPEPHTNGIGRSSSSEESFRSSVSQSQKNVAALYNERNSFSPFRPIPGGLPTQNFAPSPHFQIGASPRRLSNESFSVVQASRINRVPGSSSSEESFRCSVPVQNQKTAGSPYAERFSPNNSILQANRVGRSSDSEGSFHSSISQSQRVLLLNEKLLQTSASPFRSFSRKSSIENFPLNPYSHTGAIPRRLSNDKFATISHAQGHRITGSTSSEESFRHSQRSRICAASPYTERFLPNFPPQYRLVPSSGKGSLSSTASQSREISGASSSEESMRSSLSQSKKILELSNNQDCVLPEVKLTIEPLINDEFSPGPAEKLRSIKELSHTGEPFQADPARSLGDEKHLPNDVSQIQRASSNESFRSSASRTQKIRESTKNVRFLPTSEMIPGPSNADESCAEIRRLSESSSSSEESLHSFSSQGRKVAEVSASEDYSRSKLISGSSKSKKFTSLASSPIEKFSDSSSSSEESLSNFVSEKQKTSESSNTKKPSPTPSPPKIKSILRNSKKYSPSSKPESNPGPSHSVQFSTTRECRSRTTSRSSSSEESLSNESVPKRVEGRRSMRSFVPNPAPQQYRKISESSSSSSSSDGDVLASFAKTREYKTEERMNDLAFKLKWFARELDKQSLPQLVAPPAKGRKKSSYGVKLKCSKSVWRKK